jgi:hypothetical protein
MSGPSSTPPISPRVLGPDLGCPEIVLASLKERNRRLIRWASRQAEGARLDFVLALADLMAFAEKGIASPAGSSGREDEAKVESPPPITADRISAAPKVFHARKGENEARTAMAGTGFREALEVERVG